MEDGQQTFAEPLVEAFSASESWQEVVQVPTPAAGSVFTHVNDSRYISRPVAVAFRFVTSAVVGNRFVSLQYQDANSNVLAHVTDGVAQVASSAVQWFYGLGIGYTIGGGAGHTGSLPDFFLEPGGKVTMVVSSIDVGDQLDRIFLVLDRHFTHGRRRPRRRRHLLILRPLDDDETWREDVVAETGTGREDYYR